jgi:hypothetical protein
MCSHFLDLQTTISPSGRMASDRGTNIRGQGRRIIDSVIKFYSEEKTEGLKNPLDKAAERVYVSSQLSESTVCEIRKQAYETEEKIIQFSTLRKYHRLPNKIITDDMDRCIISRAVLQYYKYNEEVVI